MRYDVIYCSGRTASGRPCKNSRATRRVESEPFYCYLHKSQR